VRFFFLLFSFVILGGVGNRRGGFTVTYAELLGERKKKLPEVGICLEVLRMKDRVACQVIILWPPTHQRKEGGLAMGVIHQIALGAQCLGIGIPTHFACLPALLSLAVEVSK
jgi:hypothetical protein